MKRMALLPLILSIASCATTPALSAADQLELSQPLTCSSKGECDRYWQRAQVFVSQNAGYKMQTVTDSIIQTFGPFGSRVELAWSVTRLPNSGGGRGDTGGGQL